MLGIIAEPAIAGVLEPAVELLPVGERTVHVIALAVSLTLATIVEMVIGELIPKNLTIARPLPTALAVGNALRIVNGIARPLIAFFDGAANRTVRRFGIDVADSHNRARTLEELDLVFRSSAEEGLVGAGEYSLLHRSLTFGDKRAADALVPRTSVTALPLDASVADLVGTALGTGHSRFPVFLGDLDNVVGSVHVKDVYRVDVEDRPTTPVEQIVTPAFAIPETLHLGSLLARMQARRTQLAVVIDEYGGTAGIITLEDILEEIVGDIEDEYDTAERPAATGSASEGVWMVDGMLHGDELAETTGFDLPDGEWETLAGFLLDRFEHIPSPGDRTEFDGWTFEVAMMQRRRIARVRITAPEDRRRR